MPTLQARRVPVIPVDPSKYVCGRCGITKSTKPQRGRPRYCRDCQDVLADIASLEAMARAQIQS